MSSPEEKPKKGVDSSCIGMTTPVKKPKKGVDNSSCRRLPFSSEKTTDSKSSSGLLRQTTLYGEYTLAVPSSLSSPESSQSSAQSPSESPAKKHHLQAVKDILDKGVSDIDVRMKSALYSVTKADAKSAIEDLETVRRMMKSQNLKCLYLLGQVELEMTAKNHEIHSLKQSNSYLHMDNSSLREKVKALKHELSTIKEEQEFLTGQDDDILGDVELPDNEKNE